MVSWRFTPLSASPTSVGFMARVASTLLDATLAKNLPHRSRENEFTDGRDTRKGQVSLNNTDEFLGNKLAGKRRDRFPPDGLYGLYELRLIGVLV